VGLLNSIKSYLCQKLSKILQAGTKSNTYAGIKLKKGIIFDITFDPATNDGRGDSFKFPPEGYIFAKDNYGNLYHIIKAPK
jgi:hypothetical protein